MSCFLSFDNWRMFALSYLTLQGACNLWESIKSTSAGDHLADHNHDPTPQVRMVMPIAPKGRLHSDSGSKANYVFFKKEVCCPLGLRTTFSSSWFHEIVLYFIFWSFATKENCFGSFKEKKQHYRYIYSEHYSIFLLLSRIVICRLCCCVVSDGC